MQRLTSSGRVEALRATIGTCARVGLERRRIARVASNCKRNNGCYRCGESEPALEAPSDRLTPSQTGIWQSMKTRSYGGCALATASKPALPSSARSTAMPRARQKRSAIKRLTRLSSTTTDRTETGTFERKGVYGTGEACHAVTTEHCSVGPLNTLHSFKHGQECHPHHVHPHHPHIRTPPGRLDDGNRGAGVGMSSDAAVPTTQEGLLAASSRGSTTVAALS